MDKSSIKYEALGWILNFWLSKTKGDTLLESFDVNFNNDDGRVKALVKLFQTWHE